MAGIDVRVREDPAFRSTAAAVTGVATGDSIAVHGPAHVDPARVAADVAYWATDNGVRAAFPGRIGEQIVVPGDDLIVTAIRECGQPHAGFEGERPRMTVPWLIDGVPAN